MSQLPPGWPPGVPPPDSAEFEHAALAWLYDHCPPDLRGYPVFRRRPLALAWMAVAFQQAAGRALRSALADARSALGADLDPGALESVLGACGREAERAEAAARSARLLGAALGGERWRARL